MNGFSIMYQSIVKYSWSKHSIHTSTQKHRWSWWRTLWRTVCSNVKVPKNFAILVYLRHENFWNIISRIHWLREYCKNSFQKELRMCTFFLHLFFEDIIHWYLFFYYTWMNNRKNERNSKHRREPFKNSFCKLQFC